MNTDNNMMRGPNGPLIIMLYIYIPNTLISSSGMSVSIKVLIIVSNI